MPQVGRGEALFCQGNKESWDNVCFCIGTWNRGTIVESRVIRLWSAWSTQQAVAAQHRNWEWSMKQQQTNRKTRNTVSSSSSIKLIQHKDIAVERWPPMLFHFVKELPGLNLWTLAQQSKWRVKMPCLCVASLDRIQHIRALHFYN